MDDFSDIAEIADTFHNGLTGELVTKAEWLESELRLSVAENA